MVDTIHSTNNLRDEIEMKDQLIDALQIKLREKQNQIDDMVDAKSTTNQKNDATCDTEDLIQKIDATCDTEDLIQKVDAICDIEELIQMVDVACDTNEFIQQVDASCDTQDIIQMVDATCDTKDLIVDAQDTEDMESSIQLMEEIFVKEEPEEEAQNDNRSNNKSEETKEQQNNLSKMFVRPWEELSFNKDRHGLRYDKGNNFHIPDYSKPVQFVSAGFLEEVKNLYNRCQHCHRVGHLESQCFDLHPCLHCGKTNHLPKKCRKKKKVKQTINYGWINSRNWNKQVKKLHRSYHLVKTKVKSQQHGEMATIPDDFDDDLDPILYVL
jgi:hypothetical protein